VGPELHSSVDAGNQWFFNGLAISGADGPVYTPILAGSYSVSVTNQYGCTSTSDELSVDPTGGVPDIHPKRFAASLTGMNLFISPAEETDVTLQIIDITGKIRMTERVRLQSSPALISLESAINALPAGYYFLHLTSGGTQQTFKLPHVPN
jgi:hypothetical protein